MAEMKYKLLQPINYYSKRYHKWVRLEVGYPSDGATGVKDIKGPILRSDSACAQALHELLPLDAKHVEVYQYAVEMV